MSTVITVENLGKKYTISHQQREEYSSLRDVITNRVTSIGQRLLNPFRCTLINSPSSLIPDVEDFWALKDISFKVEQGDRVGIIGRNGAGKSTLLKILSRITEPTTGSIKIRGRVASLLEVGTGFHPELTGRENIYLNGAILGMRRAEIKEKFCEIVEFSEIERFLDTPVKRYSSGMYVRLAFAVAAHLEPEILVVDEVLAVGDAAFQKKCLGKMKEVGNDGRTLLFVSHNMTAIKNLCKNAVYLKDGCIHQIGDAATITEEYLKQSLRKEPHLDLATIIDSLPPDPVLRLLSVDITQNEIHCDVALNGIPLKIEVRYEILLRTSGLRIYFDLRDEERNILFRTFNDDDSDEMSLLEPGVYVSRAIIPPDLLAPRRYELRLYGTIYNVRSIPPEGVAIYLEVKGNNGIGRAYPNDPVRAKLMPRIKWQNDRLRK
ncbi:MAG: ABC transporter ATP-binding protein [Desulfuromonadaceae bacterium]|nr:ABC transporter ATP-binding protein [Desulfuromonadaceae bacterium]MDD2854104.1 ABC transporter ATP-binding protein [Desulfuromonadaceae bacterium]